MNLHEQFFCFLALYTLIDYIIYSKDMYLLQTGMTVSSLFQSPLPLLPRLARDNAQLFISVPFFVLYFQPI